MAAVILLVAELPITSKEAVLPTGTSFKPLPVADTSFELRTSTRHGLPVNRSLNIFDFWRFVNKE
jgi:hypothetical protein